MLSIQQRLFEQQDTAYADFQSKLIPTLAWHVFIGVRVPVMRQLAKQLANEEGTESFLQRLPHQYYDENMLHAILLSEKSDYEDCLTAVDQFLPFIDNWAVCDILSPKIFKKNRHQLLPKIREWASSNHIYTKRFAIVMLMSHYLDDDFNPEYLEIPAFIHSEEYYVNMGIAWFYATALAKQWESSVTYLEKCRLYTWIHNKTIQKDRESFRVSDENKEYLVTLRVKTCF